MIRYIFKFSCVLCAALFAPLAQGAIIVDNFGDSNWDNGDTRNDSGVNVGPTGRVTLDVASPGTPPSSYNSLQLTTTSTASSKATLHQVLTGTELGALANLSGSFTWYKASGTNKPAALKFGIDTTDANPGSGRPGETAFDKMLVYEPVYNGGEPDNTWVTQTFSLNSGDWWLVGVGQGTRKTIGQWLSDGTYGTRLTAGSIMNVQLGVGSGIANSNSYVNSLSLTFGPSATSETYYFGNLASVPEPSSASLAALGIVAGLARWRRRRTR